MVATYLEFFISLIILIISANAMVKYISLFARKIKISEIVIASTIIAFGTSLPEFGVTISGIFNNAYKLSLGNIIGSNIVNIGLIIGSSIILFPLRVGTEKTQRNNFLFLLVMIIFFGSFVLPHQGKIIFGLLLIAMAFAFFVLEFVWGIRGRNHEDKKYLANHKNAGSMIHSILISLGSLAVLLISSKYLVDAGIKLANFYKLDQELIGLTIIAIGTSLPELMTSLVSGSRRDDKLLLGDIQGSNIINLTLMGGITIIVGTSYQQLNQVSLLYLFSFTVLLFFLVSSYKGKYIPRYWGWIMVVMYLIYILNIYFLNK